MTPGQGQALGIPEADRNPTDIAAPSSSPLRRRQHRRPPVGRAAELAGFGASQQTRARSRPSIVPTVGDNIPVGDDGWKFIGSYTKTEFTIDLPSYLAPGTTVWFTAQWYYAKAQNGPAARPVSIQANYGSIKLAA